MRKRHKQQHNPNELPSAWYYNKIPCDLVGVESEEDRVVALVVALKRDPDREIVVDFDESGETPGIEYEILTS